MFRGLFLLRNTNERQSQDRGNPNPQPITGNLPPSNEQDFGIWLCCYKIKNPNPVKSINAIIIYDAAVFCLELIISLIFVFTRPIIQFFSGILKLLILICIIGATISNLKGLELAIRAKRLYHKLCCYNIARVAYYILLTWTALTYLVGLVYPNSFLPAWIKVWGIILIILCIIGVFLQPAMYAFTRNYTSTAPPSQNLVIIQGQVQGYPVNGQQLPPGWINSNNQQAQMPVQMQEINMNPNYVHASQNDRPLSQACQLQPFVPFQGRGTVISGTQPKPIKQDLTPKVRTPHT